jgi:hypothetical protein
MTVVASFGAPLHLSFANNQGGSRSRSNSVAVAVGLANNTVVAIGWGVFLAPPNGGGGWHYMIKNAKPGKRKFRDSRLGTGGGTGDDAVEDDSITVLIHGRCTTMVQLPGTGRGRARLPAKRRRSSNDDGY